MCVCMYLCVMVIFQRTQVVPRSGATATAAVAVGLRQRLYSGVGIFNLSYLSSPFQIWARFRGLP